MRTFEGRIKELENILIDNFLQCNSYTCFFLSHCHTDHMFGLDQLCTNFSNESNHRIYCSPISRLILLNKYGTKCKYLIKELVSPSVILIPENDVAPSYSVTVTPIPAGHCPGSLMFLFETTNKTILYTGDFRILKNDIDKFKFFHNKNQIKPIDKLYLDSTFLNEIFWEFPSRTEVVAELLNLIKKWISSSPAHNVLLKTSALYGYEFVYVELARKLKCKIHVRDVLHDIFWNVPEIGCFLTRNCTSTRLHALDVIDKKCLALNGERLLKIRLSAQWYKTTKGFPKQPIWKKVSSQKFLVCYSTHCSCSELVDFLNYLQPRNIEPCTVAVSSTKEDLERKSGMHDVWRCSVDNISNKKPSKLLLPKILRELSFFDAYNMHFEITVCPMLGKFSGKRIKPWRKRKCCENEILSEIFELGYTLEIL